MSKLFLSSKGDCSFWKCHPFPGCGGKRVKISMLRGILSGAVSSQPQSLVLWLRLFSWHLIITLLILILPLRSSTTWWCSVVVGILRDSKTAGKNISGKKEKKARTKQKIKAVLSSGSVFRWIFYFFHIRTCSVLCKAESVMTAKRYYCPFRRCSFLDTVQD